MYAIRSYYDSDSAIDLRARLERAVSLSSIDTFFAGLEPKHPDYAALREAYATESEVPQVRTARIGGEPRRTTVETERASYNFV